MGLGRVKGRCGNWRRGRSGTSSGTAAVKATRGDLDRPMEDIRDIAGT
jgi:hypothetical protein